MALTSEQGYKTPAGGLPPGAQGEGESADFKMTDLDAHKKELIMQAVQEAIKGKAFKSLCPPVGLCRRTSSRSSSFNGNLVFDSVESC